MALNTWRMFVTDLSYVPLGEITNASERQVSIALNKIDTASFKVRYDNKWADLIQGMDCYIKIYRNSDLVFYGPVYSTSEQVDSQGGFITANCTGPAFQLAKRIPVKNTAGLTYTSTPRSQIAWNLIDVLNTQYTTFFSGTPTTVLQKKSIGETGIGVTATPTAGGSITYIVPPFKYMQDILMELSAAIDGFDWRFIPHDNWAAGALTSQKISYFTAASPMSVDRPGTIFEFGDGRLTVASYTRTRTRDNQVNAVTHLLNGQPENAPVMESLLGSPSSTPVGVLEAIVQADLTDTTLRDRLVSEHLNVRVVPKDTIVFEPTPDYGTGRMPQYGTDYNVGDTIRARARLPYGSAFIPTDRFNGVFRVWGVNFTIDDNGVEKPSLVLEDQS